MEFLVVNYVPRRNAFPYPRSVATRCRFRGVCSSLWLWISESIHQSLMSKIWSENQVKQWFHAIQRIFKTLSKASAKVRASRVNDILKCYEIIICNMINHYLICMQFHRFANAFRKFWFSFQNSDLSSPCLKYQHFDF